MKFMLCDVGRFKTRCSVPGCGNTAHEFLVSASGQKTALCSVCLGEIAKTCAKKKQQVKKGNVTENAEKE